MIFSITGLALSSYVMSHSVMLEPVGSNSVSKLTGNVNSVCEKGKDDGFNVTTNAQAGGFLHVKLSGQENQGNKPHYGGGCAFSLSYDDGKTFKLIATTSQLCPILEKEFNVPIPANAPAGKALFTWHWIPTESNAPEYYMTCARVFISGGTANQASFNAPLVPILNLKGYDKWWTSGANGATSPWINNPNFFPAGNKFLVTPTDTGSAKIESARLELDRQQATVMNQLKSQKFADQSLITTNNYLLQLGNVGRSASASANFNRKSNLANQDPVKAKSA